MMRPPYLILAAILAVELFDVSCASRVTVSPQQALPKALAQLKPAVPASGPLAKPENSRPGVAPTAVAPASFTTREALPEDGADKDGADQNDADQDGAAESEEFLRRIRLPGGGPLDPERYLSARRHAEAMRHYSISEGRFVPNRGGLKADSLSPTAGLTGGWTSLGPGNVGGRTRSLVINPINPNIMFAGSVSGGVWKSIDAGGSWTPVTDLVPTDYVVTLAMSPTDPNTIYAGTGETYSGDGRRGLGILKTTDAGATWVRLPNTANSSYYYVNKIVIAPSGNVYAATNTGVYRSMDGGNTWSQTLARSFCYEITARPDGTADYLFVSCSTTTSSNGQFAIFRNPDSGGSGTWTNVFTTAGMARTSLAIARSQPDTIYAMSWSTSPQPTGATGLIGVFRSLSSGDSGSWTTQTSNADPNRLNTALLSNPSGLFADVCSGGTVSYSGQGGYDNVLAVDPVNPSRVWAGGVDMFRSDDGGANWGLASYWNRSPGTEYAHADRHAIVFHPGYDGVNNQTMYLGTDGGVFRTDNATAAVQTGPKAECSPNKSDVAWVNLNHGYAVTQYLYGRPYPGGAAYFGGSQDNGTSRGTDGTGPEAWTFVFGGDGGWVAIDPTDPNTIYYEYVNSATYRSSNGGASTFDATHGITEPSSNFQFLKNIAMDPSDPQRLYVGGKTLWRTLDGAKSWTEAGAPVSDTISAITVSPADPNTVMFSGSSGAIYRSSNALRSDRSTAWVSSVPRASATAAAIAIDPTSPQVIYAVYPAFKVNTTDNHIYKSRDGGQTWAGMDGVGTAGIPDIPVNSLVIDPLNSQVVYIGTDLGIYVSLDGGASWSRDVNPFVDSPVTALALERGSGTTSLFAFTYGRSAWKVQVADSGTPCSYSVDQTNFAFGAGGGTGTIQVQTAPGCIWSAVSPDNRAVPQSPAGGNGPGTVYFTLSPSISATASATSIAIQNQLIDITQAPADAVSANDEVASAEPVSALPYVAAVGSQYTASPSDPIHSCTGSRDLNTAWYAFTPPSTGTISLRLTSAYPAVLSTYHAAAAGGLGPEYTCFAFSTSAGTVTYTLPVTAGAVLYVEASFQTPSTASRIIALQMVSTTTPILLSVSADQTHVPAGGHAQLLAHVAGTPNTAVRWTIAPPLGKISAAGLYTAPATIPSSATVLATATTFADNATQASLLLNLDGTQPASATVAAIQNAASYQSGSVSPGEIIVIYGSGFGPDQLAGISLTTGGAVDSSTGGIRVFFDGIAAPVVYAASGQLSVVVPYEVANRAITTMEVKSGDTYSAAFPIPVVPTAPGLFLADPANSTQLALFNQDGTLNSATNPAPKGSIVTCYGTGEGATNPTSTNGQINTKTLPKPLASGTLTLGGQIAPINYLGAAPGFVAGVFQMNFTVPVTAASGSGIPVVLTVGGRVSGGKATMAIQ